MDKTEPTKSYNKYSDTDGLRFSVTLFFQVCAYIMFIGEIRRRSINKLRSEVLYIRRRPRLTLFHLDRGIKPADAST